MIDSVRVVLVAESWGKHEAIWKHALVHWSGRELARMLAEAGLAPPLRSLYPSQLEMIQHWKWLRAEHGIAVTNVFNEHPDGDKTELFFDRIGSSDYAPLRVGSRILHLRPEYQYHVDRLFSELFELRPNLIVALGNFACWALLGRTNISAIHGTVWWSDRANAKVLAVYHPAALRDWGLRPTMVSDLTWAKRECAYPEIRRPQRYLHCEDPITHTRITLDEIRAWFHVPSSRYSVDIETGYALFDKIELKHMDSRAKRILSGLISMVSFARDPNDGVVVPFMTRNDPELNYWSQSEEIEAWNIVKHQLASNVPKVFQNGIFDISHFIRPPLTLLVRNCTDDTMILSHSLYPEQPKSLGFLGSRFTSEIAWKLMGRQAEQLKRDD